MPTRTTSIRLTAAERAKLQRLAQQGNMTPATALRTLLANAQRIEPAKPAKAIFKDNGAAVSEAPGAVVTYQTANS